MPLAAVPPFTLVRSGTHDLIFENSLLTALDFTTLPSSDPHIQNALWNNSGVVMISQG